MLFMKGVCHTQMVQSVWENRGCWTEAEKCSYYLNSLSSALQLWPSQGPCCVCFHVEDRRRLLHQGARSPQGLRCCSFPWFRKENKGVDFLQHLVYHYRLNSALWFPCPPTPWRLPCPSSGGSDLTTIFPTSFGFESQYYVRSLVDEDCKVCDSFSLVWGGRQWNMSCSKDYFPPACLWTG